MFAPTVLVRFKMTGAIVLTAEDLYLIKLKAQHPQHKHSRGKAVIQVYWATAVQSTAWLPNTLEILVRGRSKAALGGGDLTYHPEQGIIVACLSAE